MTRKYPRFSALVACFVLALLGVGATVPFSTVVANGDLSGHFPGPTVAKLKGATIGTAGGALTTGKVLRVTGASAADWGALDLANSSAVTGSLPKGNQDAQDVGGDLTGSTTSATVAKVNGATYPAAGALTTGTVPRVTGSSAVAYGAVDLANSSAVTGLLPIANVASGFTKANGTVAFTGDQSFGGHEITSVLDPTGAQSAATKNYVDTRDRTFWVWAGSSAAAATGTKFLYSANAAQAAQATEGNSIVLSGVAASCTEIRAFHTTALTTDTIAYTMRTNGVDTALTCTVAANGTTCSLTGQAVTISKGDKISMSSVQSGTQGQASLLPRVALTCR